MATLYDIALEAIQEVFSDTSVSAEETRESLQGLKDEIDILMNTLPKG